MTRERDADFAVAALTDFLLAVENGELTAADLEGALRRRHWLREELSALSVHLCTTALVTRRLIRDMGEPNG